MDIINQHSKQWIDDILIATGERDKLKDYFNNFEIIDQITYPYEYLSDVVTKNTIEIIRISPNDANKGFGKEQNIETKLRGYKLGAFGGFFKKAWRSNDMLWGRLDGLGRIVDGLITPKSIKNFTQFSRKYRGDSKSEEEYVKNLVLDSLPQATDEERKVIIDYLQQIKNPQIQDEFEKFLDCLVKAGQRQILSEDLDSVLADFNDSQGKSTEKSSESEQPQQPSEKSQCLDLDKNFEDYQKDKESQSNDKVPSRAQLQYFPVMWSTQILLKYLLSNVRLYFMNAESAVSIVRKIVIMIRKSVMGLYK